MVSGVQTPRVLGAMPRTGVQQAANLAQVAKVAELVQHTHVGGPSVVVADVNERLLLSRHHKGIRRDSKVPITDVLVEDIPVREAHLEHLSDALNSVIAVPRPMQ